MNKQMKNGDEIQCTLGTATSCLQVSDHSVLKIGDENMGLASDNVGGKNIPSFGSCKRSVPPPACIPSFCMKWILGQELFKIRGEKILLDKSFIPCIHGGVVTFVDKG